MSARILHLPIADQARIDRARGLAGGLKSSSRREPRGFHYWRGASGRRYVHSIYGLLDCPPMPAATYVLVHRGADGTLTVLRIGQTAHEADSLNLAHVRRHGAELGATEVHVHLLADTGAERATVEFDLRAAFAVVAANDTVAALLN